MFALNFSSVICTVPKHSKIVPSFFLGLVFGFFVFERVRNWEGGLEVSLGPAFNYSSFGYIPIPPHRAMAIAYSREAKVIISPKAICTLGSQLILCSQNIHSHCFAFSTLMLIRFLSFQLCNNHLHSSTF